MSKEMLRLADGKNRAALYARVSTEEQAMHGVSLDAQKQRLYEYATDNALCVVGFYIDDGVSARKRYTARESFMRMLGDVKAGKIDIILFVKLDRWFRNIADYYEVQSILDAHGVCWIATDESYDTATANGRLSLNIKLAIAQDEADRTSERIKFVFSNMVKEGRVISGSVPLGFKIVDKRLSIDEDGAAIVRFAFKNYISLRSLGATKREILSVFGKSIDTKSLKRMLTNTRYIGKAYDTENWCPSIIDKESFLLANSILKTRSTRNSSAKSNRVYLFSGIIFCGECGKRLSGYVCGAGANKEGAAYYRCPAHASHVCQMKKQPNERKLESALAEQIFEHFDGKIILVTEQLPKKEQAINLRKKAIISKIERLKDLYLCDLLPKELYIKEYDILHAELTELSAKAQIYPASADKKLSAINTIYESLTPERKREFWSRIIKKITVANDGEISIEFCQL